MADMFAEFKERLSEIEEWLSEEYKGIRAGRVAPAILDSVKVEVYGSKMPVQQLATITIEDPRTIRVSPWDASTNKAIENAVIEADLGLSVNADDNGLRVSFPELTSERRDQLIKTAKQKLEEARVSVRGARDDIWDTIQKQEKDGEITEDDKYRFKDQMEKLVSETNDRLEQVEQKKEKEIKE